MIDAVHESRALLRLFERSALKDLYIRTPNYSFFVARASGAANPLREVDPRSEASAAEAWSLTAPHVASVRSILPMGAQVQAGAIVATLDLLGETFDLTAECDGVIAAVLVAENDLVEFDRPILRIARA